MEIDERLNVVINAAGWPLYGGMEPVVDEGWAPGLIDSVTCVVAHEDVQVWEIILDEEVSKDKHLYARLSVYMLPPIVRKGERLWTLYLSPIQARGFNHYDWTDLIPHGQHRTTVQFDWDVDGSAICEAGFRGNQRLVTVTLY